MDTAKVDQGGNKSNNAYGLPFRISKTSDKSSQNSTYRNLLRPSIHLTWKIRVQMLNHALPRPAKSFRASQPTPSYSYKSRLHLKEMVLPLDLAALDVQNLERSATTAPSHTSTCRHNLSMNRSMAFQICANLLIISQNWLTLQGSSTALDRQSPKNSIPKKPPRATTCLQQLRRSHRQIHAPTIATCLHAPHAYLCPPASWYHW